MSPGCAPNAASTVTSGKFRFCCGGGEADADREHRAYAQDAAVPSARAVVADPAVTVPLR